MDPTANGDDNPPKTGAGGPTGVATNNPNFRTLLANQPSAAGASSNNQVPLLIGATPLQQQISALQGLVGGGQAVTQNNTAAGEQPQQPLGLTQSLLFAGAQGPTPQSQGISHQSQVQQQTQQQPNMGMQGLGMMTQNSLLGASMGFNVQQLQQLQLAQQLMAAGLPPQLAFGGQPLMGVGMPGIGLAQTPQLAALNSNPVAASLGITSPGVAALGAQGLTTSMPGAAGLMGAQPTRATGTTLEGQDWAEPFSGKGKKEPPFPLKLHQILSNPEFQECICWNPHGRSWRILKPPVFEQLVIPLYFRYVLPLCAN